MPKLPQMRHPQQRATSQATSDQLTEQRTLTHPQMKKAATRRMIVANRLRPKYMRGGQSPGQAGKRRDGAAVARPAGCLRRGALLQESQTQHLLKLLPSPLHKMRLRW